MVFKIKNADFSATGLGKIQKYINDEVNELDDLNIYSEDKLNAIDVFLSGIASFKSKIKKAYLLANNFNESKYNLMDSTDLLSLIGGGSPSFTGGYTPQLNGVLSTNFAFNNEFGFVYAFGTNSITTNNGLMVADSGVSGAGGETGLFYLSKDWNDHGATGNFGGVQLKTSTTKYLSRGSVAIKRNATNTALFIDGNSVAADAANTVFSTFTIDIGAYHRDAYNYTGKIGFVAIGHDVDSGQILTNMEMQLLDDNVNDLLTALAL